MKKVYYPKLSKIDLGNLRIGGPGLANCMFLAAKAYIEAYNNNGIFLRPSWMKFSIGPLLRKERDKRVYSNIFNKCGIGGISKLILLMYGIVFKKINEYGPYDLAGYFTTLNDNHELVKRYFKSIESNRTISKLKNKSFYSDKIAIHVRMGDYPEHFRVPIDWYCNAIEAILKINPSQQFLLFSDGSDEELLPLMNKKEVTRVFYGNAYADMKAISYSKLLLASDSTFSAWGAFLGDVPIVFAKRHFPSVYADRIPEYIVSKEEIIEFFQNKGRVLVR